MTDKHSQSFFGQATGMTIQSSSKSEPFIFLKCIKKKLNGMWEKPTLGEGKTIKCSLDEIVMILQVLKRKISKWSTVHAFNDKNTQISFNWQEKENNKLWINIGDYSKVLSFAQVEIFRMLLDHILKEKIKYATVLNVSNLKNNDDNTEKNQVKNRPEKINFDASIMKGSNEKITHLDIDKSRIIGSIKTETEKALLVIFNSDQEVWIPKSTIHSQYTIDIGVNQAFLIDNWILERNQII